MTVHSLRAADTLSKRKAIQDNSIKSIEIKCSRVNAIDEVQPLLRVCARYCKSENLRSLKIDANLSYQSDLLVEFLHTAVLAAPETLQELEILGLVPSGYSMYFATRVDDVLKTISNVVKFRNNLTRICIHFTNGNGVLDMISKAYPNLEDVSVPLLVSDVLRAF